MRVSLGEIAAFLGAELKGDPGLAISGVAPLEEAAGGSLSFLANPKYHDKVASSGASALLLSPRDQALGAGRSVLLSENPYRDFARVTARWFCAPSLPPLGVHPSAVISPGARIGPGCRIGAYVVVEDGAEVGEGCVLFPFCYLGPGTSLGAGCLLHPSATVLERCRVGDRVILHSGVVIGSDGFGFAPDYPRGYVKVPQVGWVEIEDDVEIQANACVDRGALGPTRVCRGAKLDNMVHVAHNVVIGAHSVLAAQVGVSGSTKVGQWVTFAGQAAAGGHLTIGDGAVLTGQSGAGKDVPPKAVVSGSPAQPMMEHHRGLAEMARLPKLKERIRELERRLEALEKKSRD